MKNLRKTQDNPKIHPDFTIRHAHLSRISDSERKELMEISDFCLSQIGCRVLGLDAVKGSQYFIEDHTQSKSVKSVFENADLSEFDIGVHKGLNSFSRSDIVTVYLNAK